MMKFVLLMTIVGAAVAMLPPNPEQDGMWALFKEKFQKKYQPSEEQHRRLVWENNMKVISRHNLEADVGIHSYKAGVNEYADLTHEEFVNQMNGFKQPNASSEANFFVPLIHADIPAEVDWRKQGLVTPVKNQKDCGSCWAFSTTGSLEGQHMKKTKKLVSLSEQNLIDCTRPEGNSGCNGGWMDAGFKYIVKNKGIDTEASYPYTHEDGTCKFTEKDVGATCTGCKDIPHGDEKALQVAVAQVGPISVAIDASSSLFQLYKSGIFMDPLCSTTSLDHAVLVVGYGTEDGVDYWLVKNSWGASWGEKGYIKMSRNKNNQCGIVTQASYPLV